MTRVQTVGQQTLATGDALTLIRELKGADFDVVVTSPPYNIGVQYSSYEDNRSGDVFLEWLEDVAEGIKGVLAPQGSFFLNLAGSSTKPYLPFDVVTRLRSLFVLQNHISWVKSIDDRGHFKPVGGNRFLHRAHEHIFHLTHAGDVQLDRLAIGVPFADKSNIARRGHARDVRCRGNTWFIPYDTIQRKSEKFDHPAGFPVALPSWCIQLHGVPGASVLDPFMGTGTTLVAAQRLGAFGMGIDMDPGYVETAKRRLEKECLAA